MVAITSRLNELKKNSAVYPQLVPAFYTDDQLSAMLSQADKIIERTIGTNIGENRTLQTIQQNMVNRVIYQEAYPTEHYSLPFILTAQEELQLQGIGYSSVGQMMESTEPTPTYGIFITQPRPIELCYPMQLSSTEGSFAAIDPASPSSQPIVGYYEGNGLVSIDSSFQPLINCVKGLRKNCCPALSRLEEFTSYRNERFLFKENKLFTAHEIEHLLRSDVTYEFSFGKTHQSIDDKWLFIMKFAFFDFPISIASGFEIFL
jgi:hypothetical protein